MTVQASTPTGTSSSPKSLFEKLVALIPQTPDESTLVPLLTRLKYALEPLSKTELQSLVQSLRRADSASTENPPELLFPLLHAGQDESVKSLAAAVITKLASVVGIQTLCSTYLDMMVGGLQNADDTEIQSLVLTLILDALVSTDSHTTFLAAPRLFPAVLDCLSSQNHHLASQILHRLGASQEGLDAIFSGQGWDTLSGLMESDEVTRIRILETLAGIAAQSPQASQKFMDTGVLDDLVTGLLDPDALVAVNIMEILTNLLSPSTLPFMLQTPLFPLVTEILSMNGDREQNYFLINSAIKFITAIADKSLDLPSLDRQFHYLPKLSSLLRDGDAQLRESVVVAVGSLTYYPPVLSYMVEENTLLLAFVETYKHAHSDLKVRCLESLSVLFGGQDPIQKTSICKSVYLSLGNDQLRGIIDQAKSAFLSTRVAAYAVLKSMTEHAWGLEVMRDSSEFISWVLDRNLEKEKVGKEWKFSVVQAIALSPISKNVFDRSVLSRFARHSREGPFYVETEAAVALASGQ